MAMCERCEGDVILALTDRGKLIPLQPYPDPAGPLAVSSAGEGKAPRVRYLRGEDTETDNEVRMMAHWDKSPRCKPPRRRGGAQVIELAAAG
jgi:hypothetical protein